MSKMYILVLLLILGFASFAADAPVARSKAEVDKLVDAEGATPPPWLDAVKLNYPPTLGLHWEKPQNKEPWTPSKYLGQFIWTSINENPGRWREGLKVLYHVYDLNKDDTDKSRQSMMAIARIYQYLLNDPLRAAYWWRKAGMEHADEPDDALGLAQCYAQLGDKQLPRTVLEAMGNDDTRFGDVIKLWADIGEYQKALDVAKVKAEQGDADVAYLMAGETCRKMGDLPAAIDYYQKALKVDPKRASRGVNQTKARAQASLTAVKLYDALDLKKIADGTYSSDSYGYSGQVFVNVTVKDARIESVKIAKHTEKQYYASLTDTPAQIIKKQTVKGIDTFSSATITSEAVINAAAKALAKGAK